MELRIDKFKEIFLIIISEGYSYHPFYSRSFIYMVVLDYFNSFRNRVCILIL